MKVVLIRVITAKK